jgi:VanZ family protein
MPPHRLALLPAFVLLALYFWGNSQPEAAGLIPPPWDKLAHAAWYAVLAGLLVTGLGRRAWPWVLAAMLLLAGWDEWHQSALPGRHAGVDDWLADVAGAAFGIWLAARGVWWGRQA